MELDFLKAEHAALLDLRQILLASLDGPPDPGLATSLLATMNRILLSHLAKEDVHLYPHLRRNGETAPIAERFVHELGRLAGSWTALIEDWPETRIGADWRGFHEKARPVLFLLAERVRYEEAELYPLIERKTAA